MVSGLGIGLSSSLQFKKTAQAQKATKDHATRICVKPHQMRSCLCSFVSFSGIREPSASLESHIRLGRLLWDRCYANSRETVPAQPVDATPSVINLFSKRWCL